MIQPFSDLKKLEKSLANIQSGVERYFKIMSQVSIVNVSTDMAFQTLYNGFYRIRRNLDFRTAYFELMELGKTKTPTFEDTLRYLHQVFDRIEPSFSSKLVATLAPEKPVWDSLVLKHLQIKAPPYGGRNRLEKSIDVYHRIELWYEQFLDTDLSKEVMDIFDKVYPLKSTTPLKKIDFALWSLRE